MAKHDDGHDGHHVLKDSTCFKYGGALLVLTVITVYTAKYVDLGSFNFGLAMLIASTKALIVALIFMNLLYDSKENGVIFGTSFVFLAIFFVLTSFDLLFRPEGAYTKGVGLEVAEVKSSIPNPWLSTPELVKRGKEIYAQQCVSCHGAEGKGDGPAASALNPRPRNFLEAAGWKNGRKPTMVFKTLKEGIPGGAMASFVTMPSDDRWGLSHYVLSLGPAAPKDTPDDFAKIGIDPAAGGAEKVEKTIPVEAAIQIMAVPESN